ncbi:MAG: precorrin-6A/cobalt-precorrin-6A reductase, partial [Clostridium sp.]
KEEIIELVKKFDYVVDATHPYAKVVTEYIREACTLSSIKLIRVIRESLEDSGDIYVDSIEEAVDYLNKSEGNILLTTGSNNIHLFNSINRDRLYARVLPSIEAIEKCINCSIKGSRIIAMQGPFTKEMNIHHIRYTGAKFLVTKESGKGGGYGEKILAAKEEGIKSIVIGRPESETGYSVDKSIDIICPKKKYIRYFPMFISLEEKFIRIIGGGSIALRRLKTLINFTSNIEVIAPSISEEVNNLCKEHNIKVINREFNNGDILGCNIILALTNNKEVNLEIYRLSKENNIICNIADSKDKCDFYFPGIAVKGPVVIGVTASGEDHRLAKVYTEKINKLI